MGSHGSVNKPLIWFLAGLLGIVVPGRALSSTSGCRRSRVSPPIYSILEAPREQAYALRVVGGTAKNDTTSDRVIGRAFFHVRRQRVHGLLLNTGSETKRTWWVTWHRIPRTTRAPGEDRALVQSMVAADLEARGRHEDAADVRLAGHHERETSLPLVLIDIALVTLLGRLVACIGGIFAAMLRHVFTTNRESRRERSIRFQRCPRCGYCIAHLRQPRCPECGEVPLPDEQWPQPAGALS